MKKNLKGELYKIMENNEPNTPRYLISKEIIFRLNFNKELNISEIAKNTYVSKPTITRFAQSLGFYGFKDFLKEILTQENKYYFDVSLKGNYDESYQDYNNLIKSLIDELSCYEETLISVSKLIKEKRRVFIFTSSDNLFLGKAFADQLTFVGIQSMESSYNQFLLMNSVNKGDIVIFLVSGFEYKNLIKIWNNIHKITTTILLSTSYTCLDFDSPDFLIPISIEKNVLREQLKEFSFKYLLDQLFNLLVYSDEASLKRIVQPRYRF